MKPEDGNWVHRWCRVEDGAHECVPAELHRLGAALCAHSAWCIHPTFGAMLSKDEAVRYTKLIEQVVEKMGAPEGTR